MKKTLIILIVILTLMVTGCDMDLQQQQSVLGAYSNPEGNIQQDSKTDNTDVTLLYYPDMDTNPVTTTCLANYQLLKLVYQPVICLDEDFKPKCILAESYTETDNTVTVVLKSDLKFSDGSQLTANDVVKSIKIAQKNVNSPYYSSVSLISKCYANDERTLICAFKEKFPDMAGLLDVPVMKNGEEGTGSGLYKLSTLNGKPVLEKNEYNVQKTPVDIIHLVETKTDDYVTTLFSAGELDVLSIPGNDDLTLTSLRNYTTVTYPSNNFIYIGVNTANEIFADVNVRYAISSLIDREKIASQTLVGLAEPTVYPFNPKWYKMSVYSVDANPKTDTQTEILKDKKLTLLTTSESDIKKAIADALVENFKTAGITLELNFVDLPTYNALVTSGQYDLYLGETAISKTMDPTFLYKTGGSMNYCGFSDPVLDLAYEQYKEAGYGFDKYLEAFSKTMPVIPIAFRKNVMYSTEGLEGWSEQTAWNSYGNFSTVTLK